MVSRRRPLLEIALLAALPLAASAQAQFSINNPLVKPAARGLAASAPAAAKETSRVPVARPVNDGSQPPWPGAVPTGGGLPSQSSDSAVRDELSAYTVVAIVGDSAMLRTNVGLVATTAPSAGIGGNGPGNGAAMPPSGNGAAAQQAPRQQAMRVRTGQAITVAGASVVPSVGVSTVEFRTTGGRGALLFTASLDSQSPQAFVPATREAADPAVAARATPTPPTINGIAPAGGATSTGAGGTGTANAGR
jgi:hypothetical protein